MKILVLRFSSIGDIVLTTPVVRALKQQLPGARVHYATKPAYRGIVAANPYVDQVHCLSGPLGELVAELRTEQFDFIVDLHHNLRTRIIRLRLGVPASSFDKLNLEKWLLVNLKVNRLPAVHIVQRYLAAAAPLGVTDDGRGLDYFIPPADEVDLAAALPADFQDGYVALAIGAQHATKRLPTGRLIELCRQLHQPVVLLGGPEDQATGEEIVAALEGGASADESAEPTPAGITANQAEKTKSPSPQAPRPLFNACGRFNLNQSASLVRQAALVISHDTGLMHIAAAFGKDIISIWGNTVPEFGMYPFRTEFRAWEVKGLDCRPCSKIGYAKCPRGHFRCMNDQAFDFALPPDPRRP